MNFLDIQEKIQNNSFVFCQCSTSFIGLENRLISWRKCVRVRVSIRILDICYQKSKIQFMPNSSGFVCYSIQFAIGSTEPVLKTPKFHQCVRAMYINMCAHVHTHFWVMFGYVLAHMCGRAVPCVFGD